MPKRKPPCERGCEFRTDICHKNCDRYKKYTELLEQDREARLEYLKSHSAWTVAKSQSIKRKEEMQRKKAQGVKL